ncbi:TerB family tellurite resistance protein [Formosa sp. 3Alg 14/1]|uniref:TerB family tellurite resistance protein n=1 Tax=unclassified Formosa TaxID=2644710 RepID=UPI0039BE2E77
MLNRIEKLSLLSEMIAFAKTDEIISLKYNFLLSVSKQLNISRSDFEYLINNPIIYKNLESYSERIVQFYRLVLLLNLDNKRLQKDDILFFNYGLRMGLSHDSTNKVLHLMDGFPNNMVPADVLIDIFKVQYN